ncbi:MAG TPA: alpha/beta fold hydrolase [Anaerolineales bacterium]|nr:alpha/beta fold hydrolase [Anaerolineales bacterium]
MNHIIPTAEPFFIPAGPTGCLLIHGFTGSPKEMRWMGEYLAREGISVLGVRLAGHATRPEDMTRMRWEDWVVSVEDGWHTLKGVADQVFLAGLSMGGVLALLFAADHPVSGVIAMSTPYALKDDFRLPYVEILSWVWPRIAKGPSDWRNLEAAADHVDYPAYPTRAIAELRDLLAAMRSALPRVQVPALLMHSRQDTGVPPENSENIFAALGSQDKEIHWIEDSGHVITREPKRQQVFHSSVDFIRRVTRDRP